MSIDFIYGSCLAYYPMNIQGSKLVSFLVRIITVYEIICRHSWLWISWLKERNQYGIKLGSHSFHVMNVFSLPFVFWVN